MTSVLPVEGGQSGEVQVAHTVAADDQEVLSAKMGHAAFDAQAILTLTN